MTKNAVNKHRNGSSLAGAILAAAIIVLVVLPIFSFILEGYIFTNKIQVIRDAVDITNMAAVNSLDWVSLSKTGMDFDYGILRENYERILAENLLLDANLRPQAKSVLDGNVEIEELSVFMDGFPLFCPLGTKLNRSGIHSVIAFIVKPTLYGKVLWLLTGKEFFEFTMHTDTELPADK